tara:strand:- start:2776 stop:3168 length:393 start_codon:yes stop_codon:yes gene_type:complete
MEYIQYQWIVYFYSPQKVKWFQKWRKKGFHHCGAIRYDPEKKTWINLEVINSQVLLENLDREEVEKMIKGIKRLNGTTVQLTRRILTKNPSIFEWWIKEHSCVSFVQRLIGMKRWFIFTPYQLYCALKKL